MQESGLKPVMRLSPSVRLDAIAEGIEVLAENVVTLSCDMHALRATAKQRGGPPP